MTGRPPERDELDSILDLMLSHAQDLVRRYGEFFPFGVTVDSQGQTALSAAYTGSERPPSQEVIDLLADGMRAQAEVGRIRASAICYDSRLTPEGGQQTDAIAVSLEHAAGDAALVMQPYSKGRFTGFKFGDVIAVPPPPRRVFRAP